MPQFVILRRRFLLVLPLAVLLAGFSAYGLTHGEAPEPVPVSAEVPKYAARAVEGRVAIYRAGARFPMEVTEIEVDSLPQADRAALEAGIELPDEEAIAHLLEDYS